ncbi:MAG: hypothetical protein ACYTAF_13195 [Planctomycetota bacterium]|jgi:hypothetical protein
MNEELQEALTELITKSLSGIDTAKEFFSAEIPDVISQLLVWHGVYNFILFLCGAVLLSVFIFLNYRQYKWWKKKGDISDHPEILANLLQIFPVMGIHYLLNFEWLQIWVAPKVWLLEYASKIVR